MIEAGIVGLICVVLGWSQRFFKYGLECAFTIIIVFLSMRYMWGNDMPGYYYTFNYISSHTDNVIDLWSRILDLRNGQEVGWTLINYMCKSIGFLGLQISLVLFQNIVTYKFVKKYVPEKWFWLSMFIYCFNVYLMTISASMLRQYLAMCIFLVASKYIIEKRILPYLLLIFLAASIHQSALLLLPVYLVNKINLNFSNERFLYVLLSLSVWFLFAEVLIGDFIVQFLTSSDSGDFGKYGIYVDSKNVQSGSVIALCYRFFMVIFTIKNLHKIENKELRCLTFLSTLYILVWPLSDLTPVLPRLGFYFYLFYLVGLPAVLSVTKDFTTRAFVIGLNMGYFLLSFYTFFNSPTWYDAFYEYNSILENSY